MSELPRVLLCSFEVVPGPTGSAHRFTEILKAIAPHFQAVALTLKTSDLTHIENFHGGQLLRVPVGSGDLATRVQSFARAVDRQLESEEYSLVHFADPFSGQVLCDQKSQRGYRVVFDAAHFAAMELPEDRGEIPDYKRFVARVRRQELSCLMAADAVLVASPLTRTYLETVGVFPNAIQILRSPTNLSFVPKPLPSASIGLRLGYIGSFEPWQGLEMLLDAVAQARAHVPVQLLAVGPEHPTQSAALRQRALELDLPPEAFRMESVSRREQLSPLLAECDLGVLALVSGERNETRGSALAKIADYLAAGRGVVASDLAASRALLSDEVASFFPPDQPAALAELLVGLARDPARRAEMGAKARLLAETELGLSRFRNLVRSLYCGLLGINLSSVQLDAGPKDELEATQGFAATENRGRISPPEESDVTQIAQATSDEAAVLGAVTDPAAPAPGLDTAHISASEIPANARVTAEAGISPDPIDPWQALVVHGYCPPPTTGFSRPTPPTTQPPRSTQ